MFEGRLGAVRYVAAFVGLFFLQHLAVWTMFETAKRSFDVSWWFWLNPIRKAIVPGIPDWWMPFAGLAALVVIGGGLVAISLKRAESRGDRALALLTFIPWLQIPALLWLTFMPDQSPERDPADKENAGNLGTIAAGLLAGTALSLALAVFSTLILGLYGLGLFLLSPLIIGLCIGFLGNRRSDLGKWRSAKLAGSSMLLTSAALITLAFEGFVCLIMAAPLIFGLGMLGALLGRWLARLGKTGSRSTIASIALTPLLMAAELLFPPHAAFESVESVEVAASPAAVWDAIVHMGPIPDPPAAPFRWGLAYPMRGEISGEGVGAVRLGVFSTGTAYERVTEWRPNEALYFDVLSDPPTMRELSPYEHVNAPHVQGYFRTLDARFTITPLAEGRTRLTLDTHHELDIAPGLYWIPFAQWAVHVNKMRVLKHFRQQAERSA